MITDKDKTPQVIYIQEEGCENMYGVNQSDHVRGMVRYVREDCVPNHTEMIEIGKKMTYYLDDRLCPYSREDLRAHAWYDGYMFAKRNWEYSDGIQSLLEVNNMPPEEMEREAKQEIRMTLKDFIERFSHNNEVWIENNNRYTMHYKYHADSEEKYDVVMDWELKYTDIADCEVIKISNCLREKHSDAYTITIDTDRRCFNFVPEKVTMDNAPLGLYKDVHNSSVDACGVCCDA